MKRLGLQAYILLIVLAGLITFRLELFASDPGLGWHLKTGEHILTNLSIPDKDIFLFADLEQKWIVDQWLSDLIMATFYQLGDWSLLYAILILIFLYTFTVYAYKQLQIISNKNLASSFATLYAAIFAIFHFICRPVIFSFLLFSIIFFEFAKLSLNKINFDWKFLLKIFLISILWANLHPSFILIWALVVCYLVSDLIQKNSLKKHLILFAVIIIGTLITPYHFKLYYEVITLSLSLIYNPQYSEWQKPEIQPEYYFLFALPYLILILDFFRQRNFNKNSCFIILSFIIFSCLGLKAVRFLPYYGIVASAVLTIFISDQLKFKLKIIDSIKSSFQRIESKEKTSLNINYLFLIVSISLIAYTLSTGKIFLYKQTLGPSVIKFPETALKLINDANPNIQEIRVLNDVNFGGYITFKGNGKIKAYIDDRSILHGIDSYRQHFQQMTPKNVLNYAKNLKVHYLLISNSTRYKELIDFFKLEHKDLIMHLDHNSLLVDFSKYEQRGI